MHACVQDGHLFSGTVARDMISQGQMGTWEKVFILPNKKDVPLEKDEVILHQVPRLMADLLLLMYIVSSSLL